MPPMTRVKRHLHDAEWVLVSPGETPLDECFNAHTGRETLKWSHYPRIYHQVVSSFLQLSPSEPIRLLEIGVRDGGSLEVWRKYFGANAVIAGIDKDPKSLESDPPEQVFLGDQTDQEVLRRAIAFLGGPPHVVIDDGSHHRRHQWRTFDFLFPRLPDGGLYFMEDTHTSYWLSFGGILGARRTAIGRAKRLVDTLHASYFSLPQSRRLRQHQGSLRFIFFFDSVIAMGKDRDEIRLPMRMGHKQTTVR